MEMAVHSESWLGSWLNALSCRAGASSQEGGLERQLETELHETRVVHRGSDRAKRRGVEIRHKKAAGGVGGRKLRMVEEVEEFRPEIQAHVFPRQGELLDNRKVGIDEVRSRQRRARRISEFASCRCRACARIKP